MHTLFIINFNYIKININSSTVLNFEMRSTETTKILVSIN